MSVAEEVETLKENISATYDAIEAKGGTVPENKNTQNLANAVSSISGGGSGLIVEATKKFSGSGGVVAVSGCDEPVKVTDYRFYNATAVKKYNEDGLPYSEVSIKINGKDYISTNCFIENFKPFSMFTSSYNIKGQSAFLWGRGKQTFAITGDPVDATVKFGTWYNWNKTVSGFKDYPLTTGSEYVDLQLTKAPESYDLSATSINNRALIDDGFYYTYQDGTNPTESHVSSIQLAPLFTEIVLDSDEKLSDDVLDKLFLFYRYNNQTRLMVYEGGSAEKAMLDWVENGKELEYFSASIYSSFDAIMEAPEITNIINGDNTYNTSAYAELTCVTGKVDLSTIENKGILTLNGEKPYYAFALDDSCPTLPLNADYWSM